MSAVQQSILTQQSTLLNADYLPSSEQLAKIQSVSSETLHIIGCQFIESQFLFLHWLTKCFNHQRAFGFLHIATVLQRLQSGGTIGQLVDLTVFFQVELLALMKSIQITLFSYLAAQTACTVQFTICSDGFSVIKQPVPLHKLTVTPIQLDMLTPIYFRAMCQNLMLVQWCQELSAIPVSLGRGRRTRFTQFKVLPLTLEQCRLHF